MTSKQKHSIIIIYGILLAAFLLLFFMIPFARTTAVWLAFIFGEISVILGYFITAYAFNGTQSLRSKVYGMPIFNISCAYTCIQLVFSFIIFIAGKYRDIPAWVVAVISVLFLAAALVGTVAADNARDIVEKVDEKLNDQIYRIKAFRLDADALANACEDADAKKLLEKFAEKVKYSDPVSSPALEDIEQRLTDAADEIKTLIDSGNYDDITAKINAADRLLDERNRLCKAEKGNGGGR